MGLSLVGTARSRRVGTARVPTVKAKEEDACAAKAAPCVVALMELSPVGPEVAPAETRRHMAKSGAILPAFGKGF